MVYPCNLVNRRHLEIDIGGDKLREWIVSRREHGKLTELGNGFWLWEVETERLNTVNQACGEAGISIAWKPVVPKKPKRKLP